MPQEQHVVRCYACKKFQVQIVKKAPKWQCKVCSEKQSLMKVFAQGSGKDCRQHVQNLNMQQGLLMSQGTPDCGSYSQFDDQPFNNTDNLTVNKASKWSEYLDDDVNGLSHTGANSWEEEEGTLDKLPRTGMSRGRKRKLSNQDDCEDYSTYEQNYQPEAEVLDLSSGPCASDVLKNIHVKQHNTHHSVSPHSGFSSYTSSKSKWSQFVSPKENDLPSGSNAGTQWCISKDKFNGTATSSSIQFGSSNCHAAKSSSTAMQKGMENESNALASRGGRKPISSIRVKNPFCTTDDDENLDTIFDF